MKAKLLGAIATLALVAGASCAQAAIVDVTYNGTVTSDTELTGIFGPANGSDNLVGSTFQITYRFNTTQGTTYSSPTENFAYGYGASSPSLGATVKVGSITGPAIAGSYFGEISGYNDPSAPESEQYHDANDYIYNPGNIYVNNIAYGNVYNYTAGSTIPASIDTPFTYTVQPGDGAYMVVAYDSYDYNTGASVYTNVDGNVTSITETLVGAPGPLPGAGVLGLAGLVLAGGFARARAARG